MCNCDSSAFEVNISNDPPLSATLQAQIFEGDTPSNNIIEAGKPWRVHVEWELTGALVPCICGYWCLNLFMESIGPGPEIKLPSNDIRVKLHPCEGGKYSADIDVYAGTIQPEHCSAPYKAVVGLTYLDVCERPGPMAGYYTLPIINFYENKKQGS